MKGLKAGAIIFLTVLSGVCFADGKAFVWVDRQSMRPVLEQEQRALILYKDGIEGMLISISLDLAENENAFWIFPLPAEPKEIKIDLVDSFPRIKGKEPRMEFREYASSIPIFGSLSQLYPICMCMPALGARGLHIHSEIEKWGIQAEVISVQSAEAMAEHLQAKGIGIEMREFDPFLAYFGDQYAFVLVSIASAKEILDTFPDYNRGTVDRRPALYVEFPTDTLYFPLKPTSGYGEEKIPINLMVQGYVKPVNSEAFSKDWFFIYCWQRTRPQNIPDRLEPFFESEPFRYMRMSFNQPAYYLKEDLWMEITPAPFGIRYSESLLLFASHWNGVVGIEAVLLIFIFLSYVGAGLTGLIVRRKWHPYAYLGLGNMLTIVGVYLLIRGGRGVLLTDLKGSKFTTKLKFLFIFSLIFVSLTILMYILLCLPTGEVF